MSPLCTVPSNDALSSLPADTDGLFEPLPEPSRCVGWERKPSDQSGASTPSMCSTAGSLHSEFSARSPWCSGPEEIDLLRPGAPHEALPMHHGNRWTSAAEERVPSRTSEGSSTVTQAPDCGTNDVESRSLSGQPRCSLVRHDQFHRTASEMRLCFDLCADPVRASSSLCECDFPPGGSKVTSPTPDCRFPPRSMALNLLLSTELSIERHLHQWGCKGIGEEDTEDPLSPSSYLTPVSSPESRRRSKEAEHSTARTELFFQPEEGNLPKAPADSAGVMGWFKWSAKDATAGDTLRPTADNQHESPRSHGNGVDHEVPQATSTAESTNGTGPPEAELPEAEASSSRSPAEASGLFSWLRWSGRGSTAGDELKPTEDSQHVSTVSHPRYMEHQARDLHAGTTTLMQSVGLTQPGPVISGAIVLTGNLEEKPEEICNALREALLSSVEGEAFRTANELVACVWRGSDFAASAGSTVVVADGQLGLLSLELCSFERFEYEVVPVDPHDKLPVLRSLLLEAASAGARRFLPALVDSFPDAGRLAVRLEVSHIRE